METAGTRLVEIMLDHLKNVSEQFNVNIERCEMPPYYKWQSMTDFHEKESEQASGKYENDDEKCMNMNERNATSTPNLVKQVDHFTF